MGPLAHTRNQIPTSPLTSRDAVCWCNHKPFYSQRQHKRYKRGDKAGTNMTPVCAAAVQEQRPSTTHSGLPEIPKPAPEQQTLRCSFTVGGLGMHTAEYSYIRVRPAHAGEGRYFVRVLPGTNCSRFRLEQDDADDGGEEAEAVPDDEETTAAFLQFLDARDLGYEGTFDEWQDVDATPPPPEQLPEPEEVQGRSPGDIVIPAHLDSVEEAPVYTTCLSCDGERLRSPEALLAAMEACGVDNARIEVEGGSEVPVVDGSAMGWCIEIQLAGVRAATLPSSGATVGRRQLAPQQPVTVMAGDAFISYVPTGTTKITAGVDHTAESSFVGRQWFNWVPDVDDHFRWLVAPARHFAPSLETLYQMRSKGYIKGGTVGTTIIAEPDDWYEPAQVRFLNDEPARHSIQQLVGSLSLLAEGGNAGIPCGHIVAYRADLALHMDFLRALRRISKEEIPPDHNGQD